MNTEQITVVDNQIVDNQIVDNTVVDNTVVLQGGVIGEPWVPLKLKTFFAFLSKLFIIQNIFTNR